MLSPGMSLKGPCVEDLALCAAIFRGMAFRKWLDYGDSNLTNRLIHWWAIRRYGNLADRTSDLVVFILSLTHILSSSFLLTSHSLLAAMRRAALPNHMPSLLWILPHEGPETKTTNHGLKYKTEHKQIFRTSRWFPRVFCHSSGKFIDT